MHFATDTIEDAVTTDSTSDDSFDLDGATTKTIQNAPWTRAFDTDTFYVFDTVIARPLKQDYRHGGEVKTFKKPAEELKKAAWTFDNSPYPLTHPDGPVSDVDDVHGFFKNPQYVEDYDEKPYGALVEKHYVPTNDDEALEFIENHRAVSVGFFNDLDWDTDEEGVDAYQRDIFGDHVAGVRVGRCSVEAGCGVQTDVNDLNSVTPPSERSDDTQSEVTDECSEGPCSCGQHVDDTDNTDDSDTTMTDENTDDDGSSIDFDSIVSGMSVDALAESNSDVESLVEDANEANSRIDVLEDKVESLEEDNESLTEELESYRADEKETVIDDITDLTSAWDEDELMEADLDELETKREVAKDAASSPSTPSEGENTDEDEPTVDSPNSSGNDSGKTIPDEQRSWG